MPTDVDLSVLVEVLKFEMDLGAMRRIELKLDALLDLNPEARHEYTESVIELMQEQEDREAELAEEESDGR